MSVTYSINAFVFIIDLITLEVTQIISQYTFLTLMYVYRGHV